MKSQPVRRSKSSPPRTPSKPAKRTAKVHPVVIYPFRQPEDFSHLRELYGMIERLDGDRVTFARPITVIDHKTSRAAGTVGKFPEFRRETIARHSDVLDAWCVDTCQMWYSGLGTAFERGAPGDVHWLIPGDFNYASPSGRDVLSRLHDLPDVVLGLDQDVCIGEISTDHNNSKQLIDTYGTFALLYNWFPAQGQEIRQYTERPRSEFFAIRHEFLGELLTQRWFAYEQTVVTLLRAVFNDKRISRYLVGELTDLLEGRESFASALQQVERTERVLKTLWRERHQQSEDWPARYRQLETQSEQIRRTAATILENLLG